MSSIAASLWGDRSLWYKLAEANGLSGGAMLGEGQTLRIPAGVMSSAHNASSFTPYDPSEAVANISPAAPKPPKKKGCGGFGQVLLVVIAIVVTIYSAGAASGAFAALANGTSVVAGMGAGVAAVGTVAGVGGIAGMTAGAMIAGGVVGAAVGSIASQAVGVATGIQDKFSWNAVALAGLGSLVGGGTAFAGVGGVAGAMVGSAVTQGIGVATGLQKEFSWAGVAAAGVGSAVGFSARNAGPITGIVARTVADAGARSLIEGTDFGDNIMAALPNVIGQTIGEAIAGGIAKAGRQRAQGKVEELIRTVGNAGGRDANSPYAPQSDAQQAVYDRLIDAYGEDTASSTALLVAAREEFERGTHSAAMQDAFSAMLLSADSYFAESIPELLPQGYSRVDGAGLAALGLRSADLNNFETGYFASLYTFQDRSIGTMSYVLANRGTEGFFQDRADTRANLDQYLGLETAQYRQAIRLAQRLDRVTNGNISFTGHSLGGGLAIAQAIATGGDAVVFNTAAVRSETLAFAGIQMTDQDIRSRFGSQITAYANILDPLSIAQNGVRGPTADMIQEWRDLRGLANPMRAIFGPPLTLREFLLDGFGPFKDTPSLVNNFSEQALSLTAADAQRRILSAPTSPPSIALPSLQVPGGSGAVDLHLMPEIAYGLLAHARQRR